jgi:hypothetical protein
VLFLSACGGGTGTHTTPPVISVSLTPSAQSNIDVAQTLKFTATVANDTNSKGVTWSVSGTGCSGSACGTFTNTTTTTATYNAPASVSANMTVTVVATSVADATKSKATPVVVSLEPTITTTSLANGGVGTTYSATLVASGGAGTLTWSLASGSLPGGLSLSNLGTISGTPTTQGKFTFTVKVTDSSQAQEGTCSQTQQLSITITPPPITVSLKPSAQTNIDQAQTLNFTATVNNDTSNQGVTWSVSGASCSGTACGTFTNPTTTAATYNAPASVSANMTVSVTATSIADTTKSASTPVVVAPPPAITTTTLPSGAVATAYSDTLAATGGSGTLTWSLASGSSLPAGLSLSTAGVISGTPTAPGTTNFTVKVTDASQGQQGPVSASQPLSLMIVPAPLTITTTSLPDAETNVAYNAPLQATGGTPPYIWTVASGSSLPSWLSLSGSGTNWSLTGTPTAAGTSNFSLTVTDSTTPTAQSKTQALSVTAVSPSQACGTGNESILKGQYAFTLRGYNVINNSGAFLAAIGSFTADGNGHITAGIVDANSLAGGVQSGSITATGSSYSVGSDYRGCATIVTPFYTFTTRFALATPASGASAGGSMEEWESGSSPYIAVGKLYLQKSIPAKLPAGSWVFQQTGAWYNGTYCPPMCRTGVVGVIKADGNGNFTDGEYDSSVLGTVHTYAGLTGTYTNANATTGRFTESTTRSGSSTAAHRVDYLVSGTKFLELVSDAVTTGADIDLVGEGELRSGSPTVNGTLVYYAAGFYGNNSNEAQFGLVSINSSSALTVSMYQDGGGTWGTPAPTTMTCSYSIDTYGKLAIPSSTTCSGVAVYLSGPNTGVLMVLDGGVAHGRVEPQSATTLTPGSYFFGTVFDVPDYPETTQNGVVTIASGGITGASDETSSTSPQQADQPVSETFTVNSDGTFSTSANAGVTSGVIVSNSKIVKVANQKSGWPTLLVISTAP